MAFTYSARVARPDGWSRAFSGGRRNAGVDQNPLADPYVLGISSGAYFGAVIAIILGGFAIFGPFKVQVGGILGAIIAISVVYAFSKADARLLPSH